MLIMQPSPGRPYRLQLFSIAWLSLLCSVHAFCFSRGAPSSSRNESTRKGSSVFSYPSDASNPDEDDDWHNGDERKSFARRSQIPQFIDAFLEKEREMRGEVRPNKYTHMIGVPMSDCHELMIELESVQRAILYHCPSLVHACIVPSMSRMPLLYVDASREPAGLVTVELYQMVQQVVRKHCFVKEQFDGDVANYAGVNKDGYRPLTMTFHKLQIDGENNEALFTVADKDEAGGLAKLQAMVADLEALVWERGWKSMWPPSSAQGMLEQQEASSPKELIPRIPLMRLPPNFESFLRPLKDDFDHWTSEDGGNGISPIFWIKWEKDVMGRNVRLREMGIYPRRPGSNDLTEQTFYLAHETVELPGGNDALSKHEKFHQDYSEKRLQEAERRLEDEDDELTSLDGDFVDPTLSQNRKILESIYGKDSELFENGLLEDVEQKATDDLNLIEGSSSSLDTPGARILDHTGASMGTELVAPPAAGSTRKSRTNDTEATETKSDLVTNSTGDGMQDRIRTIVDSRPSYNQKALHEKQDKKEVPPLDENPIFMAYRNGTLGKHESSASDVLDCNKAAFASEEFMRGFWKIVRSPLNSPDEPKDDSRSNNFVLRVDKTVSGGPILDFDTQQKAGGGTWRVLEAAEETLLRIRLVIPPKRERIIVFEGKVYKEIPSLESSSLVSMTVLGATAFAKGDTEDRKPSIEVVRCSGKVRL
jgi:hypothetical protein